MDREEIKWKQEECREKELFRIICEKMGSDLSKEFIYVAYLTDRFCSGYFTAEEEKFPETGKLLEIRIFNEEKEFFAARSMIGKERHFQWRIASEEGLDPKTQYLERNQILDIDSTQTKDLGNGIKSLMTTGGGAYQLPLKDGEKAIRVISYIGYDEDGMAYVCDNRLAGFVVK